MSDNTVQIKIAVQSEDAKKRLDELEKEFESLLRALGKSPEEIATFKKLIQQAKEGGVNVDKLDKETRQLLHTYDALAKAVASKPLDFVPDGTIKELQQLERELKRTGRAHEGLKKSASELRNILAAAATGAGLGGLVKEAIDFESAMAEVAKTTGLSGEKLQALAGEIQQMAERLPIAQEELARLAAVAGQLGVQRDKIGEFVELAAQMGTAFGMSAEEAATAVAKLSNVLGISISDTRELADVVNTLGNNMAATEPQILNVMTRTAGLAKQFGLTKEQTAALAAAMVALGKPPEVAGTAINALLTTLQTAPTAGKEFQDALRAIGYDADELAKQIRENPQEALIGFLKTLKNIEPYARSQILVKLFGREYQDDIAALVNGLNEYQKAVGLAADKAKTANALQKEFDARLKTTKAQLDLAANALKNIAINIGSTVLPAITQMAEGFADVSGAIAEFAKEHPRIAEAATYIVTLTVLVKALGPAFSLARTGISTFAATATSELALVGEAAAGTRVALLSINTAIPIIGAAIAAFEIGKMLYEKYPAVKKAAALIVGAFKWMAEQIQYRWEQIKAVFTDDTLEEAARRHEARMKETIRETGEAFIAAAEGAKKTANETQKASKHIEQTVADAAKGIKSTTSTASSAAKEMGEAATSALRPIVGEIEKIKQALTNLTPEGATKALGKIASIFAALSEDTGRLNGAVKALRQNLQHLTADELASLAEAGTRAFSAPVENAQQLSQVMNEVLREAMRRLGLEAENFRSGMDQASENAVKAFSIIADSAQSTSEMISAAFSRALESISDTDAIDVLRRKIQELGEEGKISVDEVTAALDRLKLKEQELQAMTGGVADAFQKLGIESSQALMRQAEEARVAFEAIAKSGVATASDIRRAFLAYVEKARMAMRKLPPEQQRVIEKEIEAAAEANNLRDALDEVGKKGEEAGEKISKGMEKASQKIKKAADSAKEASKEIKQAFDSAEAAKEGKRIIGGGRVTARALATTPTEQRILASLDAYGKAQLTKAMLELQDALKQVRNEQAYFDAWKAYFEKKDKILHEAVERQLERAKREIQATTAKIEHNVAVNVNSSMEHILKQMADDVRKIADKLSTQSTIDRAFWDRIFREQILPQLSDYVRRIS